MRYLLSDLFIAFNPAVELRSPAWTLDRDEDSRGELTREELIIHGSMIRQRLKEHLPDTSYRILKLYFQRPGDIDSALVDVSAIRPIVISAAKIYASCDNRFVDLCCLNEFWQTDLFRDKRFGPMYKYAPDSRPELMSRRRRRIKDCLQEMKEIAMTTANDVLTIGRAIERIAS